MSWLSELRVTLSAVAALVATCAGLFYCWVFGLSIWALIAAATGEGRESLPQFWATAAGAGVAVGVCFWVVAYLLLTVPPMTVAVSGAIREQKVSNR